MPQRINKEKETRETWRLLCTMPSLQPYRTMAWNTCWKIYLGIHWDLSAKSDNYLMSTPLAMMFSTWKHLKTGNRVVLWCLFMVVSKHILCFSSRFLSLRARTKILSFVSLWLLVVGAPSVLTNHWVTQTQIREFANTREECPFKSKHGATRVSQ